MPPAYKLKWNSFSPEPLPAISVLLEAAKRSWRVGWVDHGRGPGTWDLRGAPAAPAHPEDLLFLRRPDPAARLGRGCVPSSTQSLEALGEGDVLELTWRGWGRQLFSAGEGRVSGCLCL